MTSNLKSQSLDDLLTHAEQYAGFNLRCRGVLPGTLFLVGPKGPAVFMPSALTTEAAKDAFASDARLLSTAHGATAAVMALEAWARMAEPGVPLDPNQRPSQSPDRREVVTLVGETAGRYQVRVLPILRDAAGVFTGFGVANVHRCDHIEGRFAQLLPAQPPTAAEQARAQVELRARGIVMAGPAAPKQSVRSGPRQGFSC